MYFLLAGVVDKFRYLRYGLAIVLVFIGMKMLVTALGLDIPIWASLAFVALVLIGSVLLSLKFPPKDTEHGIGADLPPDFDGPAKD